MKRVLLFLSLFGLVLLLSCSNKYRLILDSPKNIQVNKTLNLSVKEKSGKPIDSVQYFLNGLPLSNPKNIDINDKKLGKQAISAKVFYDGKEKQINNTIIFLASQAPSIYKYEIVNEFPHDKNAFTQGLEFHDGFLYESTGQYGQSSLRKVELKSGKILQKIDIDRKYFAEGMTIYKDKVYQLTWQKNKGFVYDLETFKLEKTFDYQQSKEGWGLTHDNNKLIKSDGSERIWFLNLDSFKEEKFIEAYTNKRKAERLNELEFIQGKIYANIWQKNAILIINPVNGAIEGIANLKGLQSKVGQSGEDNVLNGIAYDQENDRLFVTGKNWNKVFEIKLLKK